MRLVPVQCLALVTVVVLVLLTFLSLPLFLLLSLFLPLLLGYGLRHWTTLVGVVVVLTIGLLPSFPGVSWLAVQIVVGHGNGLGRQ